MNEGKAWKPDRRQGLGFKFTDPDILRISEGFCDYTHTDRNAHSSFFS